MVIVLPLSTLTTGRREDRKGMRGDVGVRELHMGNDDTIFLQILEDQTHKKVNNSETERWRGD